MFRVGVLAWLHESNTFLANPTTVNHFRQQALCLGEEVREHFAATPHEVGGFFEGLEREQITAVPIFGARAVPYGTITAESFDALLRMMLAELAQAGPLDGLLVAPHGATVAENSPDADGVWLTAVREQVGAALPIIGTLDPHANLSPAMVAATNALFAYRTNPHIDQRARGLEAAELMGRTLRGEVKPTQAACYPPMVINIERQCTSESPCNQLISAVESVRERPGILGASLFLGFPYADVAEMGSAMLVVTDDDPQLAETTAHELADRLWQLREPLAGTFLTPQEAVAKAVQSLGPVCLLDMGDNVGGGSPADSTWLAHEILAQSATPAFICLYDPTAVEVAYQLGVGNSGLLEMGGHSGELHGSPLNAMVTVRYVGPGAYDEPEARHGGYSAFDQGAIAIVEMAEGLTVLLNSIRTPPFSLRQLTTFGIDPDQYQILVAKGVNAPLAAYSPVCPTILRVNTLGVTTADVTRLTFRHRRQPMYPFERETVWSGASN